MSLSLLQPLKNEIYLGEPIELQFKKTEAFNDYLIEAETVEHKLDLSLKYSETAIESDHDFVKLTILWEIPSDIPHDQSFSIVITLKHKVLHASKNIIELEKLFSVAIYENDELEVTIKVNPFVKVYGDLRKTYIEALETFDWVDQGLTFIKGDIFTCKSTSKEVTMVVKLNDSQFKLKLWTKEFSNKYISNSMVILECNLKSLKPTTKKLTIGMNVIGAVEKNKLFSLEFKLINHTDTIQAFKIEQFVTELELSNIGDIAKNTKYIHDCICFSPVDVLSTQIRHGPVIKLHPTALRIKLGPLRPGECSIVQLQALSFTTYIHRIVAVRLRDTIMGILEDVAVDLLINVV